MESFFILAVLFHTIQILFWVGVVVLIMHLIWRRKHKGSPLTKPNWHLYPILSKEDAFSQIYMVFALVFLALTLTAINRRLSGPLEPETLTLITSLFGLGIGYYYRFLYAVGISVLGVATWWVVQAIQWAEPLGISGAGIFFGVLLFALVLYFLGHVHEQRMAWKRLSMLYQLFSLLTIVVLLFYFSSKDGLWTLQHLTEGKTFFASWQIALSLIVLLGATIGLAAYTWQKKLVNEYQVLGTTVLLIIFLIIAISPQQMLFESVGSRSPYLYSRGAFTGIGILSAILFNVMSFFGMLLIILSGYVRRESWRINLGAALLLIFIMIRYFDWFSDSLDKSIFFIGAGLVLFGIGYLLEKTRRIMIASMKERPSSTH